MLIELREPSGLVSRWTADPSDSFWALVARMSLKYPNATFRLVSTR
jgi:hypothetical protein